MAIDPSIALQVKPIEVPNQLAQYSQVAQIQNAQRQGEVSQMQLDQMKRDEATLRQIQAKAVEHGGPSDLSEIANAYINSGNPKFVEFGVGLRQKLDEKSQFARIMGLGQPAPALTPNSAAAVPSGALGSGTFGITPAFTNFLAPTAAPAPSANSLFNSAVGTDTNVLRQKRDALLAIGSQQAIAAANALSKDIELASNVKTGAPGHAILSPSGQVIGTIPEAKTELQRNFEYAKKDGFKGSIFDYERQIKMAGRNPVQPVAPTITQIVDPVNPNQMITVDARRYQGGSVGSAGVLGVGGKEPGAALRTNKVEQGKTQLADDLDNLRASFDTLNNMRAIPSTERNAFSNVASSVAASRLGQLTGQAVATEAQVERDVINSARSRLVNSIKNATGMSAQQLNSNVELQTMLKSISDPGQSYQSAIRIIDDIEQAYVKGNGKLPKRDTNKAAATIAPPTGFVPD